MIKLRRLCCLSLLVSASVLGHASDFCTPPTLISPASGTSSPSTKPTFAWLAQSENEEFELELIAYMPEGEVLNRIQRLVRGTSWMPDTPLASRDATVLLRLKRQCRGGESAIATRVFNLKLGQECPMPAPIQSSGTNEFLRLDWAAVPAIHRVEVTRFVGPLAKPQATETYERPPALVRLGVPRPDLIGIRSVCQTGLSEWSWVTVESP